jgi:hypothetical protein
MTTPRFVAVVVALNIAAGLLTSHFIFCLSPAVHSTSSLSRIRLFVLLDILRRNKYVRALVTILLWHRMCCTELRAVRHRAR